MTREEAIKILSTRDAHGVLCGYTSGVTEALDMAIEALSADAEDRLYIKIYADDEPSVKAEKLYQICGETQNREVTKWLKEYFPSADRPMVHSERPAKWIDLNGDGTTYKCSNCNETFCCNDNYCPSCGAYMGKKGGGE